MSLSYRGVSYNAPEARVSVKEEVIGRYRGAMVARHVAKQAPAAPVQGLKYRGATVR
ncbi:MAG: DUF4278 domain-containing protein [Leptolyngbya sp.]|nr:DUF4278 domain-containing protein [Leptolyngbya sp.]